MADMSVYMINSLQAINNTLAFYEFGVDSRLEMIQGKILIEKCTELTITAIPWLQILKDFQIKLKSMHTLRHYVMNRQHLFWHVEALEAFTRFATNGKEMENYAR